MMRTSLFIVAVYHNMIDMHRHHEVPRYYERKSPLSPFAIFKSSAAERHVKMGYDYDPFQSSRNTYQVSWPNLPFSSVTLMTGG